MAVGGESFQLPCEVEPDWRLNQREAGDLGIIVAGRDVRGGTS